MPIVTFDSTDVIATSGIPTVTFFADTVTDGFGINRYNAIIETVKGKTPNEDELENYQAILAYLQKLANNH